MTDHAFWLYWTILVGAFIVFFLPVEIYAAIRNPKVDTLSAWVWSLVGTNRGWTWRTAPGRILVLLLFGWLAVHFAFGVL